MPSTTSPCAWLPFPSVLLLFLCLSLEIFPGVLYFFRHGLIRLAHVRVPNAAYLCASCKLQRRTVSSSACPRVLLFGLWPFVQTSATAHGLSQVVHVTLPTRFPFSSTFDSSSSLSDAEDDLVPEAPYPDAT